jgi:4-hydroxy-2-oxoheptanedioate aldolase
VATATRANRYGRVADYMRRAEEEICVLVQVETTTALKEIEAIAAVDGVDGIFIGPSDLAAAMGHLGNPQHEEVQGAILDAGARIKRAGKAAGYLSARDDEIRKTLDAGFGFVAVGSDVVLVARHSEALVRTYKKG